jgi:hypothetical protein
MLEEVKGLDNPITQAELDNIYSTSITSQHIKKLVLVLPAL